MAGMDARSDGAVDAGHGAVNAGLKAASAGSAAGVGAGGSTGPARSVRRRQALRAVVAWAVGLGAVAAGTVLMNGYWRPADVEAQAPARTAPAARPTPSAATPRSTAAPAPAGAAPAARTAALPGAPAGVPAAPGARPTAVANPDLKVVAVVNGQQISRQDLAREVVRRYGKEVLESMVNKHLILQACQQRGINITQQDVEDEVERIAKKFNLSTDRWMQLLQEERNVTPAQYRREIVWPTLALRALSAEQIQVTDDELQKAFESEFGPKVRARLISVSSKKKADDVHRKAMANPAEFNNLAKDQSEDASASVMGLIPPIRKHSGEDELERIAFGLKPGQISPVIPVANQYVILKCEEQMEGAFLGGERLKQVRAQLADKIRDHKMRTASGQLFQRLQQEAKVVNVLNDESLQKQNPGVAALINNQPVTMRQLSEECILRHGETVLDGEINRIVLTQALQAKNTNVSDADIEAEVARAAEAYGHLTKDGKPDVDAWLKQVTENDGATVELYVRDAVWPSAAMKKLVGSSAQITDEDVQKGFDANYGERVEVLAIVLSNQRQAQQVWEMARDNPTDAFFGELANQYSVEPASRANFGKVPPLRRHGGQPLLEEQAFTLKAGEMSSIISVTDKFIILRCLGRTKPVVQELTDEVRQELVRDIQEKKLRTAMAKEFDRLKEAAQIDNFLAGTSQPGKRAAAGRAQATPKLSGGTLAPATPGAVRPAGAQGAAPRGAVVPAGAAPTGPARQPLR